MIALDIVIVSGMIVVIGIAIVIVRRRRLVRLSVCVHVIVPVLANASAGVLVRVIALVRARDLMVSSLLISLVCGLVLML